MNVIDRVRSTGDQVRNSLRENLPGKKPMDEIDRLSENMWAEGLKDNKEFNSVVIGEEGTFIQEDDPDYAFLVDPLDGSSGALNGEDPWNTTAVAILEDLENGSSHISGKPVGSYIRQIDRNGTEFSSWRGEASISGEVRYTGIDYDDNLPERIGGTRIGPIEDRSLDELDNKRYISVYAGSAGRRTLKKNFLHPIQDQNPEMIRTLETGGSYTNAAVGFGKYLVAGEPKPTLPTEAAGEIFANSMEASSTSIFGNPNERINASIGQNGPKRTYTSVIAPNDNILQEALDAVNVGKLREEYETEFETYL